MNFLVFIVLMLLGLTPLICFSISSSQWWKDLKHVRKGYRKIYCKRADKAESWFCWAHIDPFGDLVAYRHEPNIGQISLNPDGTGYYCGDIEWIDAP